jgi:hypothetical protein
MISLPSGRIAGITSIRARYHALRLNQSVTTKTPRQALYRLVDVVERRTAHPWLPGNPGYRFSGETLDKLPGISGWSVADRRVFEAWLRQDAQVREIEAVRRRVVEEELPLTVHEFDYPRQLFSLLAQRIEAHSLRRASPRQWRQTLLNMRRSGVRQEELEWSGLLAYLSNAEREGERSIGRETLLAQIDFSPIRLSLSNELATDKNRRLDFLEVKQSKSLNRHSAGGHIGGAEEVSVLRYVDTLHFYKVGYLKRRRAGWQGPQKWFALDTVGNLIPASAEQAYFDDKERAFRAASEHALQHVGLPVAYTPHSRYEHKTLCGGDDYREWLLTLPDYPVSYYNKHYYERNLLLHFRTKQRRDLQGRRLLFVEEIQSDWHQSGAVKGYQNRWPGQLPPAPFIREWVNLALKLILLHAAREGYDGIAWSQGRIHESHYLQTMDAVRRLYDEAIPKVLQRLLRSTDGADLQTTRIATKEPRLHISRQLDKWLITDSKGRFTTRPRNSQQEAMRIKTRHCRQIELEVPVLTLSDRARKQIRDRGFPLFGERGIGG